jgi:O-acetyl-ADP-ribose deacetylase (regulator of RNase III)
MKADIIEGCLVKAFKLGEVEAVVHCANCFNTMRSGVAKAIVESFPEAYEADCKTVKGSYEKLGTFSVTRNNLGYIFNLYGQFDFGRYPKQYLNYEAVEKGLALIKMFCTLNGIKTIGMPSGMGSGLAGGDKYIVHKLINECFEESEIVVKLYEI